MVRLLDPRRGEGGPKAAPAQVSPPSSTEAHRSPDLLGAALTHVERYGHPGPTSRRTYLRDCTASGRPVVLVSLRRTLATVVAWPVPATMAPEVLAMLATPWRPRFSVGRRPRWDARSEAVRASRVPIGGAVAIGIAVAELLEAQS